MKRYRMLIIKTGSAVEAARRRFGDFEDWFARGLGRNRFEYEIVDVSGGEPLPDPDRRDDLAGVVVTGSPAMVSHREDWSERTAAWLAEVVRANRLPVLGVCYGHQLLAHALGGRVGPNPNGRRMGTRAIDGVDADDELLGPMAPTGRAQVTHMEVVLEPPSGARTIATGNGDPFHALHFGGKAWGVQFHPEFDAPIMRCYIEARSDVLDREGFDSGAISRGVTDTPEALAVLARFADICEGERRTAAG